MSSLLRNYNRFNLSTKDESIQVSNFQNWPEIYRDRSRIHNVLLEVYLRFLIGEEDMSETREH